MANLNHVILLGRIAKPPELKEGQRKANAESDENGTWKLCRLVIAVNRDFSTKGGTAGGGKSKDADFFDVTAWDGTAENCAKYLEVGRTVLIEGYLQKQTWEKNGEKQYKTAIIAKTVQFMPDGKSATERSESASGGKKDSE